MLLKTVLWMLLKTGGGVPCVRTPEVSLACARKAEVSLACARPLRAHTSALGSVDVVENRNGCVRHSHMLGALKTLWRIATAVPASILASSPHFHIPE